MGPSNIPQIEITITGITKLLEELDLSKSPGPDKIPGKLLKLVASEISPCLLLIFSASLHQGIVPQLETGNKPLLPHYSKRAIERKHQTIVLFHLRTCIYCKILEHIIHANIMSHLEINNILSNAQLGFRKHHSAELQLIQTSHDFATQQEPDRCHIVGL